MRSKSDRELLCDIYNRIFGETQFPTDPFTGEMMLNGGEVKFDKFSIVRKFEKKNSSNLAPPLIDAEFAKSVEKILLGVERGWMVQLVAEAGGGKSSLLQGWVENKQHF